METPNANEVRSVRKPKKVVVKAKKPKKVHPKKYVCYSEGCTAEFPQWRLALDHMTNEHKIKDPKLKKSIVYLDAKGEPKMAPRGAPKVVAYPVRPNTEQRDTIKMRETPKVLATASGAASAEGHRGNDLGQFGPNWVRTWGASAQFSHLQQHTASPYASTLRVAPAQNAYVPPLEFQYGNNAKNVTMGNPQQSSFNYGRMFRD